jgi:hypothetical protein
MTDHQRTIGNFKRLPGSDEGARYHNAIARAFSAILVCADRLSDKRVQEAVIFRLALEQMIHTIEVLRMKYLYAGDRGALIDVDASGFPGSIEFHHLETEAWRAEKLLTELPTLPELRTQLADTLFKKGADDPGTLTLLSQRTYLEMILDRRKLFLPITLYEPVLVSARTETANAVYRIHWTCFDHKYNRMHIYTMLFEQSQEGEPVDAKGKAHFSLMQVLKDLGSRAPDIGILALQIDEALPYVHPKVVRRITVESFETPHMCAVRLKANNDSRTKLLGKLFSDFGTPDDFIISFSEHTVVSKGQVKNGILGFGQLREVFAIPHDDLELAEKKASSIMHYLVMPHELIQHMSARQKEHLVPARTQVFTYTQNGDVHAVR